MLTLTSLLGIAFVVSWKQWYKFLQDKAAEIAARYLMTIILQDIDISYLWKSFPDLFNMSSWQ